jgi:hypothetical protein
MLLGLQINYRRTQHLDISKAERKAIGLKWIQEKASQEFAHRTEIEKSILRAPIISDLVSLAKVN